MPVLGLGTYRLEDSQHADVARYALSLGITLIDTSPHYAGGKAETWVSRVTEGIEGLSIVTRGGYLPSDPNGDLSPKVLLQQLESSLRTLRRESVAAYLLHSPELYLKRGGSHLEYYNTLRTAFEFLEEQVAVGRIGGYGISSSSLVEPREHPAFTSLEVIWDVARELHHRPHFSMIQYPLNLLEPGAVLEPNNEGRCVADFARDKKIITLSNRPLHAFEGSKLLKLALPPWGPVALSRLEAEQRLNASLDLAMRFESEYSGQDLVPATRVAWGHVLRQNFDQLQELERWETLLELQIRPTLLDALRELEGDSTTASWARGYRPLAESLFASMTELLRTLQRVEVLNWVERLDASLPDLRNSPSLPARLVKLYRSAQGADHILMGFSSRDQVDEALTTINAPHIPHAREGWARTLSAIDRS